MAEFRLWWLLVGRKPMCLHVAASACMASVLEALKISFPEVFAERENATFRLYPARLDNGEWIERDGFLSHGLENGDKQVVDIICKEKLWLVESAAHVFGAAGPNTLHLVVRAVGPELGKLVHLHPGLSQAEQETSRELWILLIGARQEPQPILMKPTEIVWDLLEAINAENPTFFAGIDYSMVCLYLAQTETGDWFPQSGPEATALMAGDKPMVESACRNEIPLHHPTKRHFKDLGSRNVHLLVRVVMPGILGKRARSLEDALPIEFVVLWCRVVGASNTSSFPVIIDKAASALKLKALLKKVAFCDDDEILETSICLFEAKDAEGRWLPRFSEDVSAFEETQQKATEEEIRSKALFPTQRLQTIFHSLGVEDLNVLILTAPRYTVTPDESCSGLTQLYRDVASILKATESVEELLTDIRRVSSLGAHSPYLTPFIMLENSSGTGKTQMAFNLMARKEVEVIYIDCGGEQGQVQQAFMGRSESFWRCIERDLPEAEDARIFNILPQFRLFTFGFIWVLLSGRPSFIHPRMAQAVWEELDSGSDGTNRRQVVIFLDDFPRVDNSRVRTSEVALRFMVNVFRSFGLPVVLSATNGAARDLAAMDFDRDFTQSGELWCIIRPNLPRYQPSLFGTSPFRSHPAGRALVEVIDNSRPSYARLAVDFMERNPLGFLKFIEYMDALARALGHALADSKRFASEAFRVGQLCLFLDISYRGDDLTCDMVEVGDSSHLISGHFARLRETSRFELILGYQNVPSKVLERSVEPWQCRSEFPTVEEDCLLHLCLSGGKHFEALRDSNGEPIPFVRAFADAETVSYSVLHIMKTGEARYDSTRLEMLVAGAIVVASHRNGFAGIEFSSFFSALAYELGIQASPAFRLRLPKTIAETVASLHIPFLAPPGLQWPEYLVRTDLNLGRLQIERNEKRSRICLLGGAISVECYNEQLQLTVDTVREILEGISRECVVHVVVMKSLQSLCYRKQDKNRKMRMEEMLKGLDLLHHAHFYRVLGSNDRVHPYGPRAELAAIRYMKNECCAALCPEKPPCKVQKTVFFLESTR